MSNVKLPCRIFRDVWTDEVESKKHDRAIVREDDVIEFFMPNGTSCASRLKNLSESVKREYADEIARYLSGEEEKLTGTPLEKMPDMKKSLAKELEYMNIKTVEQLVSAPDSVLQKFMGGFGLRDKAKLFLETARDNAISDRITNENEELRRQINELKAMISVKEEVKKEEPVEEVFIIDEKDEPKKKKLGIF